MAIDATQKELISRKIDQLLDGSHPDAARSPLLLAAATEKERIEKQLAATQGKTDEQKNKDREELFAAWKQTIKHSAAKGAEEGSVKPPQMDAQKAMGLVQSIMSGDFIGAIWEFAQGLPVVGRLLGAAGISVQDVMNGKSMSFTRALKEFDLDNAANGAAKGIEGIVGQAAASQFAEILQKTDLGADAKPVMVAVAAKPKESETPHFASHAGVEYRGEMKDGAFTVSQLAVKDGDKDTLIKLEKPLKLPVVNSQVEVTSALVQFAQEQKVAHGVQLAKQAADAAGKAQEKAADDKLWADAKQVVDSQKDETKVAVTYWEKALQQYIPDEKQRSRAALLIAHRYAEPGFAKTPSLDAGAAIAAQIGLARGRDASKDASDLVQRAQKHHAAFSAALGERQPQRPAEKVVLGLKAGTVKEDGGKLSFAVRYLDQNGQEQLQEVQATIGNAQVGYGQVENGQLKIRLREGGAEQVVNFNQSLRKGGSLDFPAELDRQLLPAVDELLRDASPDHTPPKIEKAAATPKRKDVASLPTGELLSSPFTPAAPPIPGALSV